ncbi:MAG: exodeoxyribonuclease III [Chloroflexota bacterium]|nr:exodeoxyribonuclease III [Chloroflexota bacterium]
MATLRICSWNVNGLRAGLRSGHFPAWLEETAPDIAGLQEVKARPEQVEEQPWLEAGYEATWHPAEEPGYSGAILLTKQAPADLRLGLETPEFEREGRVIEADYGDFVLLTSYFPNAGRKLARLDFKLAYYEAFLERVVALRDGGRSVVFMGDLNVAHGEIDVARPNEKETGFLPVEREWVDRVIESGFIDTFRALHPDQADAYSYWDPWRERRKRNIGWRIDYVFVSEDLLPSVRSAFIERDQLGSDHCPVGIELDL